MRGQFEIKIFVARVGAKVVSRRAEHLDQVQQFAPAVVMAA